MTTNPEANSNQLRNRVVKGGVWTLLGFGSAQVLRLLSNLIMTRLLLPEAFGLMAISTAIFVLIGMMTDFGINASVVRSKSSQSPEFLKTAWTLQIARDVLVIGVLGILIILLMVFQGQNAFQESSVYADARLPLFLGLICISILISSFRSIKIPLAQRGMALKGVVGVELTSQIFGLCTMFLCVRYGAGAFSLPLGMIGASTATLICSYAMLKGPKSEFGFQRDHFDEIFNYGKWLLIATLFGFMATKGNQLLFGYLFEKSTFSFYAIATIWVTAAETLVATVLTRVVYPAFSEIYRSEPESLAPAYQKFRLAADVGCLLIFIGIMVCVDKAFSLIYTEAYSAVSYYVKLIAISILFIPYRVLNTALLASGDSRRFTVITVAPGLALLFIAPLIFHFFGEKAAIIFVALLQIFSVPFIWRYTHHLVKLNPFKEILPVLLAVGLGIFMIVT